MDCSCSHRRRSSLLTTIIIVAATILAASRTQPRLTLRYDRQLLSRLVAASLPAGHPELRYLHSQLAPHLQHLSHLRRNLAGLNLKNYRDCHLTDEGEGEGGHLIAT